MNLCFSDDCNQGVNNARDGRGNTPLHRAAEDDDVDVAKLLLANSADVDSTDNDGDTALHEAARKNSVAVAEVLIENYANVDSTEKHGATALHLAAYHNHVDVAKLLLAKSANLNATAVSHGDYPGLTPLQVAERYRNQEMVE